MSKIQDNKMTHKAMVQKCIREYIEKHKREKTYIKSKRAMHQQLCTYPEFDNTPESTFYRYLTEMKVREISSGKYDFVNTKTPSFHAFIEEKKYNKHLYFQLRDPSYGPLIADYLNSYYIEYENYFHCIALQDLLICLYYYSKQNPILTKAEILKDIKSFLKRYSILETT